MHIADSACFVEDIGKGELTMGKKRVGIFGGTFDPIHMGHLIVAETIMDEFHLDKVVFIPAAVPPHKLDKQIFHQHQLSSHHKPFEDDPSYYHDPLHNNDQKQSQCDHPYP